MKINELNSYSDYNTGFDLISPIKYWQNKNEDGEYINQLDFYKQQLDDLNIIKLKKHKKFIDYDYISIGNLPIMILSKNAKTLLEEKIKGFWYQTNHKNYYAFLSHNLIDSVDLDKTDIKYLITSIDSTIYPDAVLYIDNLCFNNELLKNEYIFTAPQFIRKLLVTPKFENLIKKLKLTGFNIGYIFHFTKSSYLDCLASQFKQESFRRKLCLYNEKNNTNLHLGEYKKIWVKYMEDESLLYVDW